jgi:hypothetical protein
MNKGYTPKELGLPLPKISRIFTEGCPFTEKLKINMFADRKIIAHTHKYIDEPEMWNVVCFNPDREARPTNPDGTPSDTMMHEYAHVIGYHYLTKADLPIEVDDLEARTHTNFFYDALKKLNRTDLYLPYVKYYKGDGPDSLTAKIVLECLADIIQRVGHRPDKSWYNNIWEYSGDKSPYLNVLRALGSGRLTRDDIIKVLADAPNLIPAVHKI